MSIERLQAAIREKKTPVALGLAPEIDKVPVKILKNFEDMFGPGMMANAEALRFHGCQAMDAAQGKLPAVVISAEHYLRYGTAPPCWTRRRRSCPPSCSTAPATCAMA